MHVRKFLSCFALWVLRLQGYSQLHLYSIFEQLFCLPLIFGKGHHAFVRCVDRCIAIAFTRFFAIGVFEGLKTFFFHLLECIFDIHLFDPFDRSDRCFCARDRHLQRCALRLQGAKMIFKNITNVSFII